MFDHYYLNLAYNLALQNEGNTSPNPSVGAVIVKGDQIITQAFHPGAGESHAEVMALQQAGDRANKATLYCSLEPCAHFGKTPPCVDAIIAAGIERVVYGATDENAEAAGGAKRLRENGIQTEQIHSPMIRNFYQPFFSTLKTRRPYVYAKVAMTANGIISPADRNSRWITNETSLSWVHQLRARCDAIMVGADTVILDRPHLTVRAPGIQRTPVRIVLDNRFKITPEDCSLLDGEAPILICGSDHTAEGKEDCWKITPGVQTMRFRDPASLLTNLLEMGIRKIVIEGGQKIFSLFHTEGLIDEYVLMVAPRLITGRHFLNMLGGPEQSLSETERYLILPTLVLDGDLIVRMLNRSRVRGPESFSPFSLPNPGRRTPE